MAAAFPAAISRIDASGGVVASPLVHWWRDSSKRRKKKRRKQSAATATLETHCQHSRRQERRDRSIRRRLRWRQCPSGLRPTRRCWSRERRHWWRSAASQTDDNDDDDGTSQMPRSGLHLPASLAFGRPVASHRAGARLDAASLAQQTPQ